MLFTIDPLLLLVLVLLLLLILLLLFLFCILCIIIFIIITIIMTSIKLNPLTRTQVPAQPTEGYPCVELRRQNRRGHIDTHHGAMATRGTI